MKAQMLTLEMNKNKRKRLIDDGPAPFQRKPKQQHVAPETEDTYLQTDSMKKKKKGKNRKKREKGRKRKRKEIKGPERKGN